MIKLKAVIDLFDELVEEPLFNQLRYNESVHSYMTTFEASISIPTGGVSSDYSQAPSYP